MINPLCVIVWRVFIDLKVELPYNPGFPGGKNPPANARNITNAGSIPESGRSPGEGHATHPSILAWRISMDRGA